jgi:riboflavin kinase
VEKTWDAPPVIHSYAYPFHQLIYFLPANLPDDSIAPLNEASGTGVYYGYAQIVPSGDQATRFSSDDTKVLPMVMSLGWNPFYGNEKMSAVCH